MKRLIAIFVVIFVLMLTNIGVAKENKPPMYRIYWESKLTGFKDYGTTKFSYEFAREICNMMNREFSGAINHWEVEKCE